MKILPYLFFFILPLCVLGRERFVNYDVKPISSIEGLSKNSVNSICVDDVGYVWIGTAFGLNRYDGREVVNYYHDDLDSCSIPDNVISDIFKSEDGTLWIMTREGICSYNYSKDNFQSILSGYNVISKNNIIEEEDALWFFVNGNKLIKQLKSDKSFTKYSIERNFRSFIRKAEKLDEEHFLFITAWNGAYTLNKNTLEVVPFFSAQNEEFVSLECTPGGIYILSRNNIYYLNKDGSLKKDVRNIYEKLNRPIFLDVEYNKFDNTIWVITDGDGVLIFDADLNLLRNIKSTKGVNGVLSDNSIRDLEFYDAQTAILGTVTAGINILHQSQFKEFRRLAETKDGSLTYSLNAITEDKDGIIWLGTDGGGLKSYNPETEIITTYHHPNVLKITGVVNFSDRYLLVASYFKGLFLFDRTSKEFISTRKHARFTGILTSGHIRLYEDSANHVWICSWSHVYRMNIKSGETREPLKHSKLKGLLRNPYPYLYAFENVNDEIWFCANNGLICFSTRKNQFINWIDISKRKEIIGPVYSVTSNCEGDIVFSTSNGLYEYDQESNELSSFFSNKEDKNRLFYSLVCNSKNQIWAGTNSGLIQISKKDSVARIIQFNNPGEIGGNEFRHGPIRYSSDNMLYLGSSSGLTIFDPENIVSDHSESHVTITSVVRQGIRNNAQEKQTLAIYVKDSCFVEAGYTAASYKFKFNTFNFIDETHTQYAYKLENFEEIWHTGDIHEADYANLKPGSYVFRVKATNLNGVMAERTTNIYLSILPAWYQTLWFKVLIILIVLTLGFWVWRESLNRAKLKNQLAFEKLEQDRLKEINQMKLRFFTNISHELKTPLTLILAPLENFVRQKSSSDEMVRLFPFLYRNAQRMNLLISQLLEFRKAEMSALKLNLQKADIVQDCREVMDYFEHQAKLEEIKLELVTEFSSYAFVYDRDKLFKILFNLLGNSLKHTHKNDTITVKLEEVEKGINVKVIDNGAGIPSDKLASIFDRFYQVDLKSVGTGIGLAFAQKLVELHKGTISVESELDKGATFTVFLPNTNKESVSGEQVQKNTKFIRSELELAQPTEGDSDKSKLKVLIVEDEWELRTYLSQLLSTRYLVYEAKNGAEGLKMALSEVPDLVISDVMMPVKDGVAFCKELKADLRISHIPLVLLTAKTEVDQQLKGYKAGADAYIAKPFDNRLLLSQVEAILENRKLLKERFSHELDIKPEELSHSIGDEKLLHKAISIVEMNIENSEFGVSEFVAGVGMGRTLVYNKIKSITGKTINEFILHIRMRRAAQLLKETNKSVTEIAISCGFSDQTYFSTVFKRNFKSSPSNYRKQ